MAARKAHMLTQLAQAERVDLPPVLASGNAPVVLVVEERSPMRGIALAMLLSLPVWMALGTVLLLVR
jgi:hypothetical protein